MVPKAIKKNEVISRIIEYFPGPKIRLPINKIQPTMAIMVNIYAYFDKTGLVMKNINR